MVTWGEGKEIGLCGGRRGKGDKREYVWEGGRWFVWWGWCSEVGLVWCDGLRMGGLVRNGGVEAWNG